MEENKPGVSGQTEDDSSVRVALRYVFFCFSLISLIGSELNAF